MMSASSRKGFTLIELILFFTISSLMLAGMMVGITGSVNRQRYDDANASLLDFMQSQYNLNDNVRNNRPDSLECDSGGISAGTQPRGTSDCTIAGRIIYSSDGKEISSRPVYAKSDGDVTETDESLYLDSLGLIVAPSDSNEDDVKYKTMWQTTVYTDKSAPTVQNDFSVLILRLPSNGLTRTYVSTTASFVPDDLGPSFWDASLDTLSLCIDTSSLTNANPTGVSIQRGASTSNGVQFIPAGSGVCS